MTVLILGCTGMLGHKLLQILGQKNDFKVFGTCRERFHFFQHPTLAQSKFDIIENINGTDLSAIQDVLTQIKPDIVINAIGVTTRHLKDSNTTEVWQLNSALPQFLAHYAKTFKKRLIHVSTDCVFDGAKGLYTETDWPTAYDVYGLSKYCGEVSGPGVLTIRTSIVGREMRGRTELVEWFISQKNKSVNGFKKVIYSGVTTNFLVEEIYRVIEKFPELNGVYHVSSEAISKFDLLKIVNDKMNLNIEINSDESKISDKSLNCDRYVQATEFKIPNWQNMIQVLADEQDLYKESV